MNKLLLSLLLCVPTDAAFALTGDSLRFVRPRYLQRGDTVGIVSPAAEMRPGSDTAKVRNASNRGDCMSGSRPIMPIRCKTTLPAPIPCAPPPCSR